MTKFPKSGELRNQPNLSHFFIFNTLQMDRRLQEQSRMLVARCSRQHDRQIEGSAVSHPNGLQIDLFGRSIIRRFAEPNLRSGKEVTHMNAAAYLRSRAVTVLRNRKVLLRAAALSFAVGAIGIASVPLRAQNQGGLDGVVDAIAEGRPALVRPSAGIFSFSFPGALNIDVTHETVTLPLHKGATRDGRPVWFVITESSDQGDAAQRGVNFSNKMLNALGTAAVQKALLDHGKLVFEGTVDFSGTRVLVPGPDGFPPSEYSPGPIADGKYSPLVNIVTHQNGQEHNTGIVINAPQVANDTGKSPSVVAIHYQSNTVTLSMLAGFVDGQFTLYLHTDASSQLVAALQNDTYAPNLNAAPGIANDEPPSSRAAIIPVVNGPRGDANPMRQGLDSALFGEGDPFNVPQEQPSDPVHYTPIWDVTPIMWTDAAIAAGLRVQLHSQDAVRTEALAGNIVSAMPGTPNAGLGGLNAIGAISDCPIIVVFPGGVTFQGGVE
jgi:hypothetical protein